MANNTYTVKSGDTLSEIALKYLGSASKYKQLASWNNISNPNKISIGQVIKLYNPASSGGSSGSSKTTAPSNVAVISHFGLNAKDESELIVEWTWGKESETASYKIEWGYANGSGIWLGETLSENSVDVHNRSIARQATYNIPDDATRVRFRVKPISNTKKDSKGKETSYWTASWTSYKYWDKGAAPKAPGSVEWEVTGAKLTATIRYNNLDTEGVTHVQFKIQKNDDPKQTITPAKVALVGGVASYVHSGANDSRYKVCVRSYVKSRDVYSEWSNWSENLATKPVAPKEITTLRAESSKQVYIAWTKVETATKYTIEYTEDKRYFDKSDNVTTLDITASDNTPDTLPNDRIIDISETGKEYFFRVRAWNESIGSSWSGIKSVVLGTKPSAPTTWSSTSTAIDGKDVILRWVHNSRDGSRQKAAKLMLIGVDKEPITVELGTSDVSTEYISYTYKEADEEEAEPTYECVLKTNSFSAGAEIEWQVCTKGVADEYGPWSTPRTIRVYSTPHVSLSMESVITTFPIDIIAEAGPVNKGVQEPVGYHVTIRAADSYETVDTFGNVKMVTAGEEVYSKYYNPDVLGQLHLQLLPSSISLENGMTYYITCLASMSSGLTAEVTHEFTVDWEVAVCEPNAEIGVNKDLLTASIRPYCEVVTNEYRLVELVDGEYVLSASDAIDPLYGEVVMVGTGRNKKAATIDSGEPVYLGMDDDGNDVYFTIIEARTQFEDVWFSVYRREFDGSFTEIASDLDGTKRTTVTDPHPALDYARYRIVAADKTTGHIEYYDCPAYYVGCSAAVLQWDEEVHSFDALGDVAPYLPEVSGSMLKLMYNIDVSDNTNPEATLVEYIGRSHPVSYYGTQLGFSSSWSMEIDKNDSETIYALRRLQRWLGDVYVREPSGTGYWAQLTVSFSQKHCEVTIPVSLSITRVEGGA